MRINMFDVYVIQIGELYYSTKIKAKKSIVYHNK